MSVDVLKKLSQREKAMAALGFAVAIVLVTLHYMTGDVSVPGLFSGYVSMILLLWLGIVDAKTFFLPNKILLLWAGFRMMFIVAETFMTNSPDVLVDSFLGASVLGIFFLITYYLSRRTLGGGDVKLGFVMGLAFTLSMAITAVFFALILCAVFALTALALKKLSRNDPLPLGPFMFLGTLVAYVLMVV